MPGACGTLWFSTWNCSKIRRCRSRFSLVFAFLFFFFFKKKKTQTTFGSHVTTTVHFFTNCTIHKEEADALTQVLARCSRNIPQIGMCRSSTPPGRDWRLWWLGQATLQSDEASALKALGDRDGPDEYAVCRRRRRGTCVRCPGRAFP